MNINGSDDEENEDITFKINKNYADRYNNWRSKEEYQKLKARYGDVSLKENEDESSSESEDDNAELLTPHVERTWLKTLAAIKSNDPSLYDDSRSFFKDDLSDSEEKTKRGVHKTHKKFTISDMERKIITERDGKIDTDSDSGSEDKPVGYYEEQDQIRNSLLNAAADSESDDDLLKTKVKTKQQQEAEEEEYLKFLEGQEAELANEEQQQLTGLRDYWNRSDMTADEKFLKDFILQKKYKMHEESSSEHSDDSEEESRPFQFPELSDESDLERAENFEKKYNFRYEEPDKDFIKAYPRTLERSMRAEKNTSRKEKRAGKRDKKQTVSDRTFEDLSRLRQLKRQQLEAKLTSIKEKSGAKLMPFTEDELDEDFNPDEHDRKMKEMFPDDEEEITKPEFDFDPLIDGDDGLDYEDWDSYVPSNIKNKTESKPSTITEDVLYDNNGEIITDADYAATGPSYADDDDILDGRQPRRNRRKKSRLRKALERKKPLFNPKEKSFEEYLDEYYNLQCEDLIGDMKCRFPYRDVTANDFGLSVGEILNAPDTELNKWSSLKKAVQYRSDQEEKKDILKFRRKRKDVTKKQRVIPSLFREEQDEEREDESDSESPTTQITESSAVQFNEDEKTTPSSINRTEEITNQKSSEEKKRKTCRNKNTKPNENNENNTSKSNNNTSQKPDTQTNNEKPRKLKNKKRKLDDKLNKESTMGVAWSRMEAFGMHSEVKRAKAAKKKAKLAKGK